ncbi:MAG: protein kinase [Chloroflexia bacterium]|nr:protein kinase [Chloroflexia bacterium]
MTYQTLTLGSRVHGRYTVQKVLGGGGQSRVYKVWDEQQGRPVALKEMHPSAASGAEQAEALHMFNQEAAILSALDHPNLIQVYETFVEGERHYLAMEFVDGSNLEQRLEQEGGPLTEQQVLYWGIQICQALHYLHSRTPPIIFRDMKPTNVMVTQTDLVKLIDFGIARMFKGHKQKDTILMGSQGYAPPEAYGRSGVESDARSDIYALGATLAHLLTGRAPQQTFLQLSAGGIRKANPTVSAQTEALVLQCLRIRREERPASAVEVEERLRTCLNKPFQPPRQPAPAVQAPSTPAPAVQAPPVPDKAPPAPKPTTQPAPSAPSAPPERPAPAPLPTPAPSAVQVTLTPVCPACGAPAAAKSRFCAKCGTPLHGLPPAKLLVRNRQGQRWEVGLHTFPFLIGRRSPADGIFPHLDLADHDVGYASRRHAQIYPQGDLYLLLDLNSSNGTLLNGRPIPGSTPQTLRHGDRIRIGEIELLFQWV